MVLNEKCFEIISYEGAYDFKPFWGLNTTEEVWTKTKFYPIQIMGNGQGYIFTSKAIVTLGHGVAQISAKGPGDGEIINLATLDSGGTALVWGSEDRPVSVTVTSVFALFSIGTLASPYEGMTTF